MLILTGLFAISFLLRVAFWSRFPPGFTADDATMGYEGMQSEMKLKTLFFGDYKERGANRWLNNIFKKEN